MEADVRLPCGFPQASVRPFVLIPAAMGKYLKQISRSVYIHQRKKHLRVQRIFAEKGVAQCWRNFWFSPTGPEKRKNVCGMEEVCGAWRRNEAETLICRGSSQQFRCCLLKKFNIKL